MALRRAGACPPPRAGAGGAALFLALASALRAEEPIAGIDVKGTRDDAYVRELAVEVAGDGFDSGTEARIREAVTATDMFDAVRVVRRERVLEVEVEEAPFVKSLEVRCDPAPCPEGLDARALPLRKGMRALDRACLDLVRSVEETLAREGYERPGIDLAVDPLDARHAKALLSITLGRPVLVTAIDVDPPEARARLFSGSDVSVGKPLSARLLRRALQRWEEEEERRGVVGARAIASEERADGGVALHITVREGPVLQIQIDGKTVKPRRRRKLLAGALDSLDVAAAEVRARIEEDLEARGYFDRKVESTIVEDTIAVKTVAGERTKVVAVTADLPSGQERLLGAVATQPSGYSVTRGIVRHRARRKELEKDRALIEAALKDEGYTDARVAAARVDRVSGGLAIHFPVGAGPRSYVGSVRWPEGIEPEAPRLVRGGAFSEGRLEEDRRALDRKARAAGFDRTRVRAEVEEVPPQGGAPEGRWKEIGFDLDRGPRRRVDAIVVSGSAHLPPGRIAKLSGVKEGDPFGEDLVAKVRDRLRRVPILSAADVAPLPPPRAESPLLIELREGLRYRFRYAAGYNSEEGARGTLGFSDLAFLRGPRALSFLFRGGRLEHRLEASLRAPFGLLARLPETISLFRGQERREGFSFRKLGALYDLVLYERERHARRSELSLRLLRKEIDLFDVRISEKEIGHDERSASILSATTSVVMDYRDDPVSPSRGWRLKASAEMARPHLGADADYVKGDVEGFLYLPLSSRMVLALGQRLGAGKPQGPRTEIPISERFFLGGQNGMRAFPRDGVGPKDAATDEPLGGAAYELTALELRVPLFGNFGGSLFYERGLVRARASDLSFRGVAQDVGLGLRYRTPAGPVRIEYGIELGKPEGDSRQSRVFLSLGEAF